MNMQNFDIDELIHIQSAYDTDEHIREPIGQLSPIFDRLGTLSGPLQSEIRSPPSSSSANTVFPVLTEEKATHVDDLLFLGVDSPVFPPDIITPLAAFSEMPQDSWCGSHTTPSTILTTSTTSPLLAPSALFNPTTVYVNLSPSPRALKRSFSLIDPPIQSREPPPSPTSLRPSKRPCTSSRGEPPFQPSWTVTPLKPAQSTSQPIDKPREPRRYPSAWKREGGLTSKPARHWRVCPYTPEAGAQPHASTATKGSEGRITISATSRSTVRRSNSN